MTTAAAVLILAGTIIVVGALLIITVRSTASGARQVFNAKPVAVESPDTIKYVHRIALALERVADEQPVQKDRDRLAEQNESLVIGISTVLDTPLTHPEGLRDDVKLGRTQADAEVKERLRTELNNALNNTNQ